MRTFFIRSRLNGLVLDVRGADESPGTEVITYARGEDNSPNQLWWEDPATGTIRTSMPCNHCLTINSDNTLVLQPYSPGDADQQWYVNREVAVVANRDDPGRVLDIAQENAESGARVCAWENHGGQNQQWDFDYTETRYFWIESDLNGKVLDIRGADRSEGAEVIMYSRSEDPVDNQLWYEDARGNIRSKLNDFCLDGTGDCMTMCNGNPDEDRKFWCIQGNRIVNRHNQDEVLDIAGCCEDDGARVIAYSYNGGSNQHWNTVYV